MSISEIMESDARRYMDTGAARMDALNRLIAFGHGDDGGVRRGRPKGRRNDQPRGTKKQGCLDRQAAVMLTKYSRRSGVV